MIPQKLRNSNDMIKLALTIPFIIVMIIGSKTTEGTQGQTRIQDEDFGSS